MNIYTAFGLLVLIAAWLCGALSMVSVLRASMPNTEPLPGWLIRGMRPVASVFMALAAAMVGGRAGFEANQLLGFAAFGFALGLLSDFIWRRVRRNAQRRSRGSDGAR